ncbi:hypothetical protein CK203_058280 [Vitis vinifera]|uniref:Uncharacterized protein n=1 Tax=Vitis vinifera TaxID=29760 RepID=A0A438GNK2_VITVI|nr:hypothetical protein CK203_058280 [Vitis vinifera]
MIKRRGGQCEANQIELASTPSWATTNRAGTRSINGRIENQQLLAKEDRFFQTKPFIWKKLKELTPGWVDIAKLRHSNFGRAGPNLTTETLAFPKTSRNGFSAACWSSAFEMPKGVLHKIERYSDAIWMFDSNAMKSTSRFPSDKDSETDSHPRTYLSNDVPPDLPFHGSWHERSLALVAHIYSRYLPFLSHLEDSDDKSQVEKACGQTSHPDVCVSCVNSDPNRSTNEILFCMMREATHRHEVVDPQVRNTSEPNLKQALQTCNVSIFLASNDLTDSFMRIEGEDSQKTDTDLESANEDALQHHKAF